MHASSDTHHCCCGEHDHTQTADDGEALNAVLEKSFARWLTTTPFEESTRQRLGIAPADREELQQLYARELVRLKKGEYASFDAVWGPLLKKAGLREDAHYPDLERLERQHIARNYIYLERGTEHAWQQILAGDTAAGVPAIFKAARAGHGRALLYASRLFRTGTGVEKDEVKASEALASAAETDCGAACLELGGALMEGRFGVTDDIRGRLLLEKALRISDPDTWAGLGRALVSGLLGEDRISEGADLLRRATGRGSADAAYDLAALVSQGLSDGGGMTAFELLQLAAKRGCGPALKDLALLFLRLARTGGDGCDLSPRECFTAAARWIALGAKAGEPECLRLSSSNLVVTLADGTKAKLSDFVLPRTASPQDDEDDEDDD